MSMSLKYEPVYSLQTQKLIEREFKRLKGKCYLDHAGATLYSEQQIASINQELQENVFANAHAKSTAGKHTEDLVDQIRFQLLQFFNTTSDEYSVVFTTGATGALKVVAESFVYDNGYFTYLEDNHTSVLGMREYCNNVVCIPHNEIFKILDNSGKDKRHKSSNSLFVYSPQCNFSGFKYPLEWISKIKEGSLNGYNGMNSTNWYCMLDASYYASSNRLDLSLCKPDFVCLSFYKIFGYPTGLGALLIKNSSSHVLQRTYFGGGTVLMALSSEKVVERREKIHERFEDGTIPFLSIIALRHGFETLKRLKLDPTIIGHHTFSLARYVYFNLISLHHSNGRPACILYHDTTFDDIDRQGGLVNFNLFRADGSHIGYAEVMHVANLYGVSLRTGCFCNPGACRRHLKLTTQDIRHQFEKGHVCGDDNDLIEGRPTGSVRVSFGYMSTINDANELLNMINECFVSAPVVKKLPSGLHATKLSCSITRDLLMLDTRGCTGKLQAIQLYPIKSCGPLRVDSSWELVETGLKYDREWIIVNNAGVCLTQKQEPRMCLIKPLIDLEKSRLIITCEGMDSVSISLKTENYNYVEDLCQSKVCGDQVQGWDCGDEVAEWLCSMLGRKGLRLLKQNNSFKPKKSKPQLSLTNKAQFLLVNKASVNWLKECIPGEFDETVDSLVDRFRPNLIIDFGEIFVENDCAKFIIDDKHFMHEGQCTRCQMICIDQATGEKSVEPLRTLSKEFNGKIFFGVYLRHDLGPSEKGGSISIGAEVIGVQK